MALLYHFWQYRAYFSVRYCLRNVFSTSFHTGFNFSTFPEVLRRTQRGKGQPGRPLSFMAHTHRVHSSGGSFSFAPEIFCASSRRGSLRFTAHHRPPG